MVRCEGRLGERGLALNRFLLAISFLAALAVAVFLTLSQPSAHASPTTYTVNSTADPGDGTCDATECTLREAIAAANANAGADTIAFNIPGAGPHTISPGSELPWTTDPLIIDGTSEPDFAGTPVIELNGSGAGAVVGLRIRAGSSTVKGLVINGFGGCGIQLAINGGNVIRGNFIGTDVSGTAALGNTGGGVCIASGPNNTIGGTAAGAGNVISGNGGFGYLADGVQITGDSATGNLVQGNFIGTDLNGTADLGNAAHGVGIFTASNTVGGTAAGAGNVISGNNSWGVLIQVGTGNQVQGNFIGTDVNGTTDLGNGGGVEILDASGNTIGGTAAGAGNVISGNNGYGVVISAATGTQVTGNQVQGNFIGTDVSGAADVGNSFEGVVVWLAAGNTVGGTAVGAGNVIAFNGWDGAAVVGADAIGNTIRANSIHSNVGKGIALGLGGNPGGNTQLPPPIIDSAGGGVSGHTSPKCYPCTVEVFSDDEDEGRIYYGSTTTNDDPTGTWTHPGAVTGPNITATITDASGNTSEFSAPVAYPTTPTPTPTPTATSTPTPTATPTSTPTATSTPGPAVGGIAELPDVGESPRSSAFPYIPLAGAVAALAVLAAGARYARSRRPLTPPPSRR